MFLTDGMFERTAAAIQIPEVLLKTRSAHPREVVQALGTAVLEATGGDLRDDATVLCPLDWHGGPPHRRNSNGGADKHIHSC